MRGGGGGVPGGRGGMHGGKGTCMVGDMHGGGRVCVGYNQIRSMSGRYASYWNAFLLNIDAFKKNIRCCQKWPGVGGRLVWDLWIRNILVWGLMIL